MVKLFYSGGCRISRRGTWTSWGGVDSQGGYVYVSKILYVKIKESGPLGGVRQASSNVDPPMFYSATEVLLVYTSYACPLLVEESHK